MVRGWILGLVAVGLGLGGAASADPDPQPRPSYQTLRQDEDWSFLRDSGAEGAGDFFDPAKFVPLDAEGWAWLSFGSQLRLRNETLSDAGFGGADDDDGDFLLSRLMLHTDLHAGEHFRVFVQGRSSMVTDHDVAGGPDAGQVDNFDLHNAFADLSLPLGRDAGLRLRGGRQELSFGRGRLVHMGDWGNTRRSFDGVSTLLSAGAWKLEPFWARPVTVKMYDGNSADSNRAFFGSYASGAIPGTPVGLDLYYLGLHQNDATYNLTAGDEHRHSVGGRVFGAYGESGFDYDVEGTYQFGEVDGEDVSAFMLASELGYSAEGVPLAPRFLVGVDYTSGDRSEGGSVQTFNPLFPDGHDDFGNMDAVGAQNAFDVKTGFALHPSGKLTLTTVLHYLRRAQAGDDFYDGGGAVARDGSLSDSRELGFELDLGASLQIDRHAVLGAGWSHFFPEPSSGAPARTTAWTRSRSRSRTRSDPGST